MKILQYNKSFTNVLKLNFYIIHFLSACITPIDLAFAFENTADIGVAGFEDMKRFANSMLNHFDIGEAGTHISISTFSDRPGVLSGFGASYNKENVAKKINSLTLSRSTTSNLGNYLEFANREIFSINGRVRQATPRVLVIFTQGEYSSAQEFKIRDQARKLKEAGKDVDIIVISVGDGSDTKFLSEVVSSPAASKLIQVLSSSSLDDPEQVIRTSQEVCSSKWSTRNCPALFKFILYSF